MLGWQVRVEVEKDGELRRIASWPAESVSWLHSFVESGAAAPEDLNGGYPDRYRVPVAELRGVLATGRRDELARLVDLKPGEQVHVDEALLARCPVDAELIVTAWDQS